MFKFQKKYFFLTLALLVIEILIAVFVKDAIIRPYIGDFLVVILIYCFFKSFLNIPVLPLAISVLLFAYLIEILQYFKLIELLGLQDYKIIRIILGSSFSWLDMLAYTMGVIVVVIEEKKLKRNWNTVEKQLDKIPLKKGVGGFSS